MALNKAGLKNEIKTLMQDMMQREQASIDEFAGRLADAVDGYVKTATVTATPAQVLAAALSNGGGSVVADNNLISTLS
jgi:DNA-binding transcriptional regulator YbjK